VLSRPIDALHPRQRLVDWLKDLPAAAFGQLSEGNSGEKLDHPLDINNQEGEKGLDTIARQSQVTAALKAMLILGLAERLFYSRTQLGGRLVMVRFLKLNSALLIGVFLGGAIAT